jgi:hypothetical protein
MTNRILFGIASLFVLAIGIQSGAQAANCWDYQHPGRHEVLRRDGKLRNELNNDYGHLGGHYGQLVNEDKAIHRQEQLDAASNHGHLTAGEYRHLNHEENVVQHQINHDYRPW